MIVWFAEWLSKPRHWAVWMLAANMAAWGVVGLGLVGLWVVFK